jgi:hypothetical protein
MSSSNDLTGLDQTQAALMAEECILIDENDQRIGSASKRICHSMSNINQGSFTFLIIIQLFELMELGSDSFSSSRHAAQSLQRLSFQSGGEAADAAAFRRQDYLPRFVVLSDCDFKSDRFGLFSSLDKHMLQSSFEYRARIG